MPNDQIETEIEPNSDLGPDTDIHQRINAHIDTIDRWGRYVEVASPYVLIDHARTGRRDREEEVRLYREIRDGIEDLCRSGVDTPSFMGRTPGEAYRGLRVGDMLRVFEGAEGWAEQALADLPIALEWSGAVPRVQTADGWVIRHPGQVAVDATRDRLGDLRRELEAYRGGTFVVATAPLATARP